MLQTKLRKEVSLENDTLDILKILAEKEGRKLKNYMEHVLREKANSFELTEDYGMLDKNKKGELSYISESDFRKRTTRK